MRLNEKRPTHGERKKRWYEAHSMETMPCYSKDLSLGSSYWASKCIGLQQVVNFPSVEKPRYQSIEATPLVSFK